MKLKIEGNLNSESDIVQQILDARGISRKWLNAGQDELFDGSTMRNFQEGYDLIKKHQKNRVVIIVDNDADGITSFATMYQWLKLTYPEIDISYVMAGGKTHGIIWGIMPPADSYDLLIIPDASSSEIDKHKTLHEHGIDILILDHHEVEQEENPYAIIINPHHPQCSYPNKNLSGVGVVYKFIEAIDILNGVDNHSQFLDLVATGMVADVMDTTSMENKALINMGLANVRNPYIDAYLKADGRVKGKPFTPIVVGFYLAPQINALIRMGEVEDKLELCQAMIGEIDSEPVVAKIISIKGKQDRGKDPIFTRIIMDLQKAQKDTNNILVGTLPKHAPRALTGLIAGQIAGAYQKPVLLGRELDDGTFGGSLRSLNKSSVENLKDFCEESGLFNWVAG